MRNKNRLHGIRYVVWALVSLGAVMPELWSKVNAAPVTADATVPGSNDKKHMRIIIDDASKPIRGAKIGFNSQLSAGYDSSDMRIYSIWQFAYVQTDFNAFAGDTAGMHQALRELATKTGRPEVANLAFCPSGMSFTSGMSANFTNAWPSRTIALASVGLEYKPGTAATKKVPSMTIYGSSDGGQPGAVEGAMAAGRNNSQWAIAVKWLDGHTYGDANNMVWVLFDQAIKLRLPATGYPTNGPFSLKELREEDGWLGNWETWKTPCAYIAPYSKYIGDKNKACWFPNAYLAYCWRAFVAYRQNLSSIIPVSVGGIKARQTLETGSTQTIQISTSATDIDTMRAYDGDILLGSAPKNAYNVYRISWPKITTGIHGINAVGYVKGEAKYVSKLVTVIVLPGGSTDVKSNARVAGGHLNGGVRYQVALTGGVPAGAAPAEPWMDALGRLNTATTVNGVTFMSRILFKR